MWPFSPKVTGEKIQLKIVGMHCTNCALTIDNEVEAIPGVKRSDTNYARSQIQVVFDPQLVQVNQIKEAIARAGYQVE